MADDLIVLKIGGSVLTNKGKEEELAEEAISRIAGEIARYIGKNPNNGKDQNNGQNNGQNKGKSDGKSNGKSNVRNDRLILVHGAGSFGHPQAVSTGLDKKFSANGVSQVHRAVNKLNERFVCALIDAGVNAVPVHPISCMIAKSGRITTMLTDPIQHMIDNGIVPVLHGDVVMDTETTSSIISGDQIVTYLANIFEPGRIGLGTNVDGVLDEHGEVIPCITPASFNDIERHIEQSNHTDVTGGMMGKVCELLLLAESRIFNASKANAVTDFLEGKDIGTVIKQKCAL